MEQPTEKTCTKCGVTKPLDEFHRDSKADDGHKGGCKICHREATRARYAKKKAEADKWDENVDTKECAGCGETKLLKEFSPNAAGLMGRHSYCRPCYAARMRERGEARQGAFDHLDPDTTTKQCVGCELELPLSAFHRHANGALGRHARCRSCWGHDDDLRGRRTWGYQHVWNGRVVYVGITCDLANRNAQHRNNSPWFRACVEPTEETAILFPDRAAAEHWEQSAIRGLVDTGHVLLNNVFNVVNTEEERAALLEQILSDERTDVEGL